MRFAGDWGINGTHFACQDRNWNVMGLTNLAGNVAEEYTRSRKGDSRLALLSKGRAGAVGWSRSRTLEIRSPPSVDSPPFGGCTPCAAHTCCRLTPPPRRVVAAIGLLLWKKVLGTTLEDASPFT